MRVRRREKSLAWLSWREKSSAVVVFFVVWEDGEEAVGLTMRRCSRD